MTTIADRRSLEQSDRASRGRNQGSAMDILPFYAGYDDVPYATKPYELSVQDILEAAVKRYPGVKFTELRLVLDETEGPSRAPVAAVFMVPRRNPLPSPTRRRR